MDNLPIKTAIRLVLDSVWYSNPLPFWIEPCGINYTDIEKGVAEVIKTYLNGGTPGSVLEVWVPRTSGVPQKWLVPPVYDQIILQACVSALSQKAALAVDWKRVFSYRLNDQPGSLQFTNNPITSWKAFQDRIAGRPASQCMLQLDLEKAYQGINLDKFIEFLAKISPGSMELQLLKLLLRHFAQYGKGVPLVNDSLFFLGNAYLSEVDRIISRHVPDFVRFVDDYCLFGASTASLDRLYQSINRDLEANGFKINAAKVKLGTNQDYLNALTKARESKPLQTDRYLTPLDLVQPGVNELAGLVQLVCEKPEQNLNDGIGRWVLGAWRRLQGSCSKVELGKFHAAMAAKKELVATMLNLLEREEHGLGNDWRIIWMLFALQNLDIKDSALSAQRKRLLEKLQTSANVGPAARLWSKKLAAIEGANVQVEALFKLTYLEAGQMVAAK